MKIAICQINTTVADFDGNVRKVLRGLECATLQGAKLAIFPELTTFGYPPRDLLDKSYLIEANLKAADQIARKTTKDLGCIFGFVSKNTSPIGRGLFNSVALAFDGKIQAIQAKTLLPTYDVFDEARHFDAASSHEAVSIFNTSLALTVCEDIWSSFDFDGKQPYSLDPVSILKSKGAKILINISASPFSLGRPVVRRNLFSKAARLHQIPLIYCNLVGGNDELVFDGQSLAISAEGKILFEAKRFQEDFAIIDLDQSKPLQTLRNASDVEDIYESLLLGLKDYLKKCRFKKVVVGLSGGIDSSVVAALAVLSLGSKNVLGVSMPSKYSSASSLNDAKKLAKNLSIPLKVIPIDPVYQVYLKTLKIDEKRGVPLAAENIQARIRGNILMAISNQTGTLVLSTGNKSEVACGYCTLYGDLAGGLAILSDVPKTYVYKLARLINRRKEIIPEAVFTKPPSAELKPNQTDQDILPPYEMLDGILKAYVEKHQSPKEIVQMGFEKKWVEWVVHSVDHNEYKRRQAPPGIKVTSKAFGIGRRFPIAWDYH